MKKIPVILIFDVGKTNKKLFLFNDKYKIVYEESAKLQEIVDEDGFPSEDIVALTQWITSSLQRMVNHTDFKIKAINFSAYGASFVYIDEKGELLLPLYNYLKPYPEKLMEEFYENYGGKKEFSKLSASPILGSLNSGLQLYRIKYEKPEIFEKIKYALHLPQYLSFVVTQIACSEITSIGCHTNLWDFSSNDYHTWTCKEGIRAKLPPIYKSDHCHLIKINNGNILVGIGLHDSSAALIPYLSSFHEPFVLLSTGTWCITLNPFNYSPLNHEELNKDCLCYLTYQGKSVKASRLFAGYEHEKQVLRLSDHYKLPAEHFGALEYNTATKISSKETERTNGVSFSQRDLTEFQDGDKAYNELIVNIVNSQYLATKLVLKGTPSKRIFVDGGFSKNDIYMHLMAQAFPDLEVYAASVAQASALGTALAIHKHWNFKPLPSDIISLKYFSDAIDTGRLPSII